MSKEYDIFEPNDLKAMYLKTMEYFAAREEKGLKFQKLKFICKRWQKSKSSAQHKKYWSLISDLQEGFEHCGYIYTLEELHEFVKRGAGYTKMIEVANGKNIEVTKSIADKSEDVNSKEINFLIEWIYQFAAEKLDWTIEK